jgi:ERCC4-type nuclease
MIGRIKAYTWHDAIESIKSNFFHNQSKNFNINCEKDFAYVEEKNTESTAMENNGKENLLGYKLYLNKEGEKSESSIKDENLWDLTVATATSNNFAAVLNAFNKEQQQ